MPTPLDNSTQARRAALEPSVASAPVIRRPRPNRFYGLIFYGRIAIAAAVVVIGAVLLIQHFTAPSGPIPANIRHQLHFPLYYPTNLPGGYSVNQNSFQVRDGQVLIFSILAPNHKNIAVSEEQIPVDILELGPQDPPAGAPFNPNQHIDTPVGKAVIGLWGANYVSSLVTDRTWIILNLNGFSPAESGVITRGFGRLP